MRRLLGPHLGGQWANNLEILHKWQPRLILVLQPEVDKVKQLREACPDAIIVGRFFHDDSHYASNINARPKEFAREIHNEIANNPVTPLLDYAQSNNETNQDWAGIQKLNVFTQEWMFLADQSQAYKCAILAFSVGNPDLPHKPGDPAGFDGRMLYWQQVLPSLNYAQQKNHILLLHAYGYPDMFHPHADWYIYRYERQVQANLRTLGITNLKYAYGEIGIDRLIANSKGGYKVVANDQDYVNQLLQWEKDQQSQSLLLGGAIFTFGDSGGWDTYDIASTNVASMIATHYANHAGDYKTPPTGTSEPVQTHLPSINPGTSPAPALPPREWDARLTARGVSIETPPLAPGQRYWRVVKARWWDEQESQGRHHIYIEAPDRTAWRVVWPSGSHPGYANGKSGFDASNYPMSKSLNEFSVQVRGDMDIVSETLKGIGMGADGNPSVHTSTGVTFQLVTMPAVAVPAQPPIVGDGPVPVTPPPAPVQPPPYVPTPADMLPAPKLGSVIAHPLNVRSGPGIEYPVIGSLTRGELVAVTAQAGKDATWSMVGDGRWVYSGWIRWDGDAQPGSTPEPEPEPVAGDKWERSLAFVRRWEGGWADDPNDPGGATMKGITLGTYTRWLEKNGFAAPTKDQLRAIPDSQVDAIYFEWYWLASGSDKLSWPLCLANMDTAVNAGPGRAAEMLQKSNGNFLAYMGHLIDWYTRIDNFEHFGRAWIRRRADILLEASKP